MLVSPEQYTSILLIDNIYSTIVYLLHLYQPILVHRILCSITDINYWYAIISTICRQFVHASCLYSSDTEVFFTPTR